MGKRPYFNFCGVLTRAGARCILRKFVWEVLSPAVPSKSVTRLLRQGTFPRIREARKCFNRKVGGTLLMNRSGGGSIPLQCSRPSLFEGLAFGGPRLEFCEKKRAACGGPSFKEKN